MSQERVPMTREGYEKLRAEINHIKTVERPKNVRDIEEARAHGDLSENAEYHAAKERQSHIAGRLMELENFLSRAELVDVSKIVDKNKVSFGAHVKILDVELEDESHYQIVGDYEADIKERKISISSPIARSLIGKAMGDLVTVQTPKGKREFEIIAVKYIIAN